MRNLDALHDFFREHYRDVDLRRLARSCSNNREILADLPGSSASFEEVIFAAVESFARHGAFDDLFWECLRKSRPRLAAKIAALQASFVSLPIASIPLQLVFTRAHVPESKNLVEIEFVLRNDGAQTQTVKALHLTAHNTTVDYGTNVDFTIARYCEAFSIKAHNKGWGKISLRGDVFVRAGDQVNKLPVDLPGLPGGRWAFLWGHQDPHIPTPTQETFADIRLEVENHSTNQFSRVRRSLRFELCESLPRLPDTTYICIFDADAVDQRREYSIIRSIAPGELDVFRCAVSLTKAAHFDLSADIITGDDQRISSQYSALSIWRDSCNQSPLERLEDGDVFMLGADGIWRLEGQKHYPWRKRI